jgi:hypothetical protein
VPTFPRPACERGGKVRPGISLAENVRQFTDGEPHGQPGWKHAVSSRRSRGWRQKPSPLVKAHGVRTYSAEASQFAAVERPSFGNGTHARSLNLGTRPKVKSISTLCRPIVKRPTHAATGNCSDCGRDGVSFSVYTKTHSISLACWQWQADCH